MTNFFRKTNGVMFHRRLFLHNEPKNYKSIYNKRCHNKPQEEKRIKKMQKGEDIRF